MMHSIVPMVAMHIASRNLHNTIVRGYTGRSGSTYVGGSSPSEPAAPLKWWQDEEYQFLMGIVGFFAAVAIAFAAMLHSMDKVNQTRYANWVLESEYAAAETAFECRTIGKSQLVTKTYNIWYRSGKYNRFGPRTMTFCR